MNPKLRKSLAATFKKKKEDTREVLFFRVKPAIKKWFRDYAESQGVAVNGVMDVLYEEVLSAHSHKTKLPRSGRKAEGT